MNLINETDFIAGFEGKSARLVTITNKNGLTAQFTNYGARLVSLWAPGKNGKMGDIVLGFDTLQAYMLAGEQYHGAMVGRVCGRINNARFTLGNQQYQLVSNDVYGKPVKNHLHGGISAFHNRMWQIKDIKDDCVTFSLFSPDGDEGYPGNLTVEVRYTLTPDNCLRMECEAASDKPTIVNLTNHSFFNLQTDSAVKNLSSHTLTVNALEVIDCDDELIPTGKIISVKGSYLDFSTPKTMEDAIRSATATVQSDGGFSAAYVINKNSGVKGLAAVLEDEASGRRLEIYTNQPSLQVYNGYFMNGADIGKYNMPYDAGAGIALEPQGYPDAPNHPRFPQITLKENEIYQHTTFYRITLSNSLL